MDHITLCLLCMDFNLEDKFLIIFVSFFVMLASFTREFRAICRYWNDNVEW